METAPHQVATIASINPGITVTDGVIHYQLLPHNLVRVERGEWPFMGGRLILHETVLNFGSPSAKRLTFELQGFDAKQFIDSLGFQGLEITGTFDGVLPMIFDESGGRIVGGRLDSRPPGGRLHYTGTKPKGLMAGTLVNLLSDIRYQSMIIRLDGDLAGEFATRLTVDQVSLGPSQGLPRRPRPLRLQQAADPAQCEHQRAVPRADPDGQGVQGPDPGDRAGHAVPGRFACAQGRSAEHDQAGGADGATVASPRRAAPTITTTRRNQVKRTPSAQARRPAGVLCR